MIRTVKLENYLPLYIQEYREMWKLMQAENPEFQLANNETEKIKNNLFIEKTYYIGEIDVLQNKYLRLSNECTRVRKTCKNS